MQGDTIMESLTFGVALLMLVSCFVGIVFGYCLARSREFERFAFKTCLFCGWDSNASSTVCEYCRQPYG